MVALTALLPSTGVALDLPATPSNSAPQAQAPAPTTSQPTQSASSNASAAAPRTRAVTTPRASLRMGSFGAAVRDLQRELRRRGQRYVRVDGSFGPATRKAVKAVQLRLRMKPTGVATPAFLKKLGIQTTAVASTGTASNRTNLALGARYLRAFPVLGEYTYQDDFGAPRHQGAHEGNDIMAPRGSLVVGVADGVIKRMTRVETGLGGIWIWLQDTSGNEYYYAHLDSIADGLKPGSRVTTGQVIGTVGNTGDARYGATHLHFEVHPGGGGAVDPYSDLIALDPKKG